MTAELNVRLDGGWSLASSALSAMESSIGKWARAVLLEEANDLRGTIVKGIRDQAPGGKKFKPLSSWTLAMRAFPPPGQRAFSGTKALIRTGNLIGSVAVVESGEKVFVGVNRKKKNGMDMVNLAETHEFGSKPIVVRVTDKMRRFLMAWIRRVFPYAPGAEKKLAGPKKVVIVHQVPARPFLQPSYDKWSPGLGERVERKMKERMERGIAGAHA